MHRSHGIRFFPDGDGGGDGSGDGDGAGDGDGEEEEEEEEDDVEALKAELASLRKAEGKRKTEAARSAKAKKDKERAAARESGDAAKLRAQLDEQEARASAAELKANRASARAYAAELGAVDPSVAVRLIDFDELLDPSDEDEVKSVIAALLKEKPFLKGGKPKVDGGEGGGGNTKSDMNDIIRAAAGR